MNPATNKVSPTVKVYPKPTINTLDV